MAVPGEYQPGRDGTGITPPTSFQYIGPYPLYYLDYLDQTTQHTLYATPGGIYTMLAVEGRAGLTQPPPDGRWSRAGGLFMIRFRPHVEPAAVQMARARLVNAALQAAAARKGVVARRPVPRAPLPRRPVSVPPAPRPGVLPRPEPVPSQAAVELAAARRVNADLQARRLAGG